MDTDGSRLTGGLPDSVRYIPDGTVNALYRHGPAYRPVQILPDDEWAVWGGTWVALKSGGTLAGIGVATLLIGSLLRKRSRASA